MELTMKKVEVKNNEKNSFFKIIFLISLLYYIWWIALSVFFSFKGIDSGWAMPAMSNHELIYGVDAFFSGIVIGLLYTIQVFWVIPLYQAIYIMFSIISYFRKKLKS